MKELEKTKRISIAAVLSILLVIIALLFYKKPKNLYTITAKTALEKLVNNKIAVDIGILSNDSIILIDIRNPFDFKKGHIGNAINIYAPEVLSDKNIAIFEDIKNNNKTAVLYGNYPDEAIAPYAILMQLGFDNLKILKVENSYYQNQLVTKNIDIEKSVNDIAKFIEESAKNSATKPNSVTIKTPKKVITIKKKKKNKPEGGC